VRRQSVGDLDREAEQVVALDRLSADAMFERPAIEEFHGDEAVAVLFADVVDGTDVGMVQSGSGFGFSAKTLKGLWIFGEIFRKELDGNKTVEAGVLGFITTPMPPPPKRSRMR